MEHRNRNILVVLIGIVIVVAVFSSFGLSFFTGETPGIVLPDQSPTQSPGEQTGAPGGTGDFVRVEATPDTVQDIIATISRPESYYRELIITDYWGNGEAGRTTARVWANADWVRVEATGPTGLVRSSLVGNGVVQIWYGDAGTVFTAPADDYSADLEGQRIPTYEDVLMLDTADISDAGYEEKDGLACVYVEAEDRELGCRERYWVSVDTGLLTAAETWQGETLVYSMSSSALERPVPAGILPVSEQTD